MHTTAPYVDRQPQKDVNMFDMKSVSGLDSNFGSFSNPPAVSETKSKGISPYRKN